MGMRGFPNRMLYPDYKSRYQILGAAEIASASDNKSGVYALMDKIEFPRERYRLGYTKVFFRAGALAALEEARDNIVLKLVRWMQAECYMHFKTKIYLKKKDQRELMKVIQRNFRKYMSLRDWGWFIIIQKTKPLIGQVTMEQELNMLLEKANETWGVYEEALNVTKELEGANAGLEEESKALSSQLASEQGNLSQYQERQAKAAALKVEVEAKLADGQRQLTLCENQRINAASARKAMDGDISALKKDMDDLDLAFQKIEQEKTNRDHTLRNLQDEVAAQDEAINKLNKEKKSAGDNNTRAVEDLQAAEEKVSHLNSVKGKLESTLDDLENTANSEKRKRGDAEKTKRKVEGELRMAQETVNDLEGAKREMEGTIGRREKDITALAAKLEDEQGIVAKLMKGIKEHQGRVEELEEELEAERQARAKAERQRCDLAKEFEELGERLDQAGGATIAQIELNKKRENEISKLRKDYEEANIQQEAIMMSLKKKHQDAIQEMTEQIDQLSKMKSKIEKDKAKIQSEIGDARSAFDEINRAKASAEKSNKVLLGQLNELNKKVEESNMTLGDYEAIKRKTAAENGDLLRVAGDINNNIMMIQKIKASLQVNLEEAKTVADNEARERALLLGKYKNLEHELDGIKENLDEETASREEAGRQIKKAEGEAAQWRCKYENEAVAKAEDLEMTKMKLQARLTEAESTIENWNGKLYQLEKARTKLGVEIEDMNYQLYQAQILNNQMEKKAKHFDRIVGEWKKKVDSLTMDLDVSQRDCRNASSELFRVKNAYEEAVAQLDEVRRENKTLSNEIKDIMDQISEGGRSIHEIDKIRKRLEAEKMELQAALEEAEGTPEHEENKVLRAQLELTHVKQEIERRIAEKEDEFAHTKKNMAKALEGMQVAVETEAKAKAEAVRMKKKLEGDVLDLDCSLEHANAASTETQR